MPRARHSLAFAIAAALAPVLAHAQSTSPAVFVSNNGNLEGSVTAFTINADGTLNFVNKVVTGSRPSLSQDCPGCNAYRDAISPNGKYLLTVHPAGNVDGVTILAIAPNAAVSVVTSVSLPSGQGGPLDGLWLDNQYLVVTRTESSPNKVVVYQFNPVGPTLSLVNTYNVGTFSSYLAIDKARSHLYVGDTGSGDNIFVFSVSAGGVLAPIQTVPNSLYPIGLQVSPDGSKLYTGCGISGSSHNVMGFSVDGSGQLTALAGSPYTSPGNSPKGAAYTPDSKFLFVSHGSDSTARSFAIDPGTGNLTYTGASFSVGIQGSLGDMTILGNLLFLTDNFNTPTGVLSFTIAGDGSFTQNGSKFPSNGTAARGLAVWQGCPARGDLNCDCGIDLNDVDPFVDALLNQSVAGGCSLTQADMNNDGLEDGADIAGFVRLLVP